MTRLNCVLALTILCIVILIPSLSSAEGRTGWFFGGSASLFELGGNGNIITPNGDVEFEIQEPNAYGLVSNEFNSSENTMGLGWENNQLPGGKLFFGYRSGFHWATHVDFFWALPKNSELPGYPNEDPTIWFLEQQSSRWTQKSTRIMLDWRPFEPLPLWFLTAGVEFTKFSSRLEFRWQREQSGEIVREYEGYEDGGSAFGAVIGTGLLFSSEETPNQEWFVNMTYSYVPFNDPYFAWDGDFLLGGISLEGGVRLFAGGDE
jgi:hypothetical protein